MKRIFAICVTAFLCVPAAYAMKGDCGNSVMRPKLKKTDILCGGCGKRNYSASTTSMRALLRNEDLFGFDVKKDRPIFMLQCKRCNNEQYFVMGQCPCDKGSVDHEHGEVAEELCSERGIPLDAMVSSRELFKLCRPKYLERDLNKVFNTQKKLILDDLSAAVVSWRRKNKEATVCEENNFIRDYCERGEIRIDAFLLGLEALVSKKLAGEMQPHLMPALRRFCEHKRNGTLSTLRCSRYYVLFRSHITGLKHREYLFEECADAAALTLALAKEERDALIKNLKVIDTSMLTMAANSWIQCDGGLRAVIQEFDIKMDEDVFPVYRKWTKEFAQDLLEKIKKGAHRDDLQRLVKDPASLFYVCKDSIKADWRKILQEQVRSSMQAQGIKEKMDKKSLSHLDEKVKGQFASRSDDLTDLDDAAYLMCCCQSYVLGIACRCEPKKVDA